MNTPDTTDNSRTNDSMLPRHVAIIMDGNGRWARHKLLQRFAGHRAGVKAARNVIRLSVQLGIQALTLFAFSSENWRRPRKEVEMLLDLFVTSLKEETSELHNNNIRLRIIGDRSVLSDKLQARIAETEVLTAGNNGLRLNVAVNYGGQWDITRAARKLADSVQRGELEPADITTERFQQTLSLGDLPEPDLFIRTGGECRLSNFLLWQLAYTELYFTETLWPDFNAEQYHLALADYAGRQRRYGHTPEQVENSGSA
ncbi:MAG: polyprenyl diphosphate synthase [Granulosicoccaceae bacterium]|jgi:undecaprenyl diphosphate synthase